MKYTTLFVLYMLMSFSTILYAQDIIHTINGEDIKAKVLTVDEENIQYKKFSNPNGPTYTMSLIKILSIDYENGESDVFSPMQKSLISEDYGDPTLPDLDYDNYHGFLLEEGNVVYIPDGKTVYEQAGVDILRKLIDKDKFWQLAARPEQAHFALVYEVQTKGRDHLNPIFLQRREGFDPKDIEYKSLGLLLPLASFFLQYGSLHSSEDPDDNIEVAEELYENILKIQEIITSNKEKKWMKYFVKE